MNYYKHHIGDYAAATEHLSWDEDMAYTRLLRLYYKNERAIPADIPNACRLARATSPAQKRAVESVLREFFVLQADGWHQKRCDQELAAAAEKGAANRENGKRGGRPRKEKPAEMGSDSYPTTGESRNPTETQSVSSGLPSETLATSQEPLTNYSDAGASGDSRPDHPDDEQGLTDAERVFGLGVALLTEAGVADKPARSLLGVMRKELGDGESLALLKRCADERIAEPAAWLSRCINTAKRRAERSRPTSRHDENAEFLRQMSGSNRRRDAERTIDVEAITRVG